VDAEHGVNTAVRKLRAALKDSPEQPAFIETIAGKGYRFIGPVSSADLPPEAAGVTDRPKPWPAPDCRRTCRCGALVSVAFGTNSATPVTIAVLRSEFGSDLNRITSATDRRRCGSRPHNPFANPCHRADLDMTYKGTRRRRSRSAEPARAISSSSVRRDPQRIASWRS
jgi:hypothetical protein